ncbi:unnamed protein product [Penicillium glandicola]
MATPLFIYAATVCRFIKDPAWSDPKGQLAKALEYIPTNPHHEMDSFDATYRPVLDQLIAKSQTAQMSIVNEFRAIVGSIILLIEPLSASSLSRILNIPQSDVDRRLRTLHSVLSVPVSAEAPIRMLHLSFRDFLINPEKSETNPFWVDERKAHAKLASCCIQLLSSHGNLREDICNLKAPGADREDLPAVVVNLKLPADVQYACQYWVYHAVESGDTLTDSGQVYRFLKRHFLHWLEALSLLGKISESVAMIRGLQSLPIYSSAIMLSPKRSNIRAIFEENIPPWITKLPAIDMDWGSWLFTLEGHEDFVIGLTFSPDHKRLASCAADWMVMIWDVTTGEAKHMLHGHTDWVVDLIWSPDGKTVASCSRDGTIRFGDPVIGEEKQVFKSRFSDFSRIYYSQDGKTLTSLSNNGILQMLDIRTGHVRHEVRFDQNGHNRNSISPDGPMGVSFYGGKPSSRIPPVRDLFSEDEASDEEQVPSGDQLEGEDQASDEPRTSSEDEFEDDQSFDTNQYFEENHGVDFNIRLWSTSTGMERRVLEGHTDWICDIAWAPDGNSLASISADGTIRLWDVPTGDEIMIEHFCEASRNRIAFRPDGKIMAIISGDNLEVILLDKETLEERQEFYVGRVFGPIVFSVDGKMLAFRSSITEIRVVNMGTFNVAMSRYVV